MNNKLFRYIDEQQVLDLMTNKNLESMCASYDYEYIYSTKNKLTEKEKTELGNI